MWGKDDGKYEHGLLLWLIRQQRTAQRHAPIDYARGYYGKPKRKKVRK